MDDIGCSSSFFVGVDTNEREQVVFLFYFFFFFSLFVSATVTPWSAELSGLSSKIPGIVLCYQNLKYKQLVSN